MKNYLLLAVSFLSFYIIQAQSFQYRNYNFEWPAGKPAVIPVEDQFKNEDAVILEEKLIYNAAGNRVPAYLDLNRRANYYFITETGSSAGPIIQKHVRIKFLTTKGVKKFSTIVLPESFDPSSDLSTLRIELRDSIFRPRGEFLCIRYFAARIIKPDGSIKAAILDEKTQLELDRQDRTTSKLYSWIFRIINLEADDELEIDYSYETVFNIDPTSRIFFNGVLPKQNFTMTFRYPFEDYYIVTYANGAFPNDSVMETTTHPKYTEYYFSKKNLPGGLTEVGGRPYTQYPYITYYQHQRDFGIANQRSSFIVKPLPYPWSYILLPLVGYQYQNLKIHLTRLDNTTRALNSFFAVEKSKVTDTSFAALMSSVNHTLAQAFKYQDDRAAFEGDDQELENLGKYIDKKTLRQISRHRIYQEMLNRTDRDYYAALFCDKRVSMIDINEYKHSTSFRTGFAVPLDKNFIFLYPKSYRYGYEANELPFYYEDIPSVLIPQHEPFEKSTDMVPNIDFTFVKTPFSGVKDNLRITSAMVNVSLDSMSLNLSARIKLSGQFSTITRGYYLNGDRDTTVNPSYYNTIASIAEDPKHLSISVGEVSRQYPYDVNVSMNMSNYSAISKEPDGTYSIDLEGWFNNVIDEDFSAVNRHLDYYPDFQFQDSHKYMFRFDKKVQVVNAAEIEKDLSNGFADYSIKIKQLEENTVLVETAYVVKPEYAPAERAMDVQNIFDAIKNLDRSSLKVKIQ
jgi:hypothetical protein